MGCFHEPPAAASCEKWFIGKRDGLCDYFIHDLLRLCCRTSRDSLSQYLPVSHIRNKPRFEGLCVSFVQLSEKASRHDKLQPMSQL